MEDFEIVQTSEIKQKCPAFQEGCPFAKVEGKHLIETIEKCPEFENGCPFKDAKSLAEVNEKLSHVPHSAGHESELSGQKLIEMFKKMHDTSECLEEKLGDCPVFHKEQGCPFKSVMSEEGKHLVEPVDIVAHDQHVKEELQAVDVTHLKDQCPAFKDGCPFIKLEDKDMKEAIEKCPEFKNGCPFKDAKSLAEVYEKLSHVPHSAGHESELSGQKLIEMFKKMHDTSECLEEKLGDCPVFNKDEGCPFKSVRSEDGKHLVEPATAVLSTIRESVPSSPSKTKIMKTAVQDVQESCPAFQGYCPFAEVSTNTGAFESAMKCPKFKDGCAFKDCKSVSDIYLKLKEIPNLEDEQGSHSQVLESLKILHDMCVQIEKMIGECPVFKTEMGCPFKTICGDQKPMVIKMEENLPTKLISEGAHEAKQDIEDELLSSTGVILHEELRDRTAKIHRKVETGPFVKQLFKGQVNVSGYKLLLSNLYFVYKTLEDEADKHQSHPMFKKAYFPFELRRTPEIIKDLEYYFGSDWKDEVEPYEVTKRYLARLRQLSEEEPVFMIAHQYTRYLGDVAGGQIFKKVLKKYYNLSGTEGIRFYEFDNIPNISEFKNRYRNGLDSLQLEKKDADRMVNESLIAFQFHVDLFVLLADLCGFESDHQAVVEDVTPMQEPITKKLPSRYPLTKSGKDGSSNGALLVVFGLFVALFAILYSYFLA